MKVSLGTPAAYRPIQSAAVRRPGAVQLTEIGSPGLTVAWLTDSDTVPYVNPAVALRPSGLVTTTSTGPGGCGGKMPLTEAAPTETSEAGRPSTVIVAPMAKPLPW